MKRTLALSQRDAAVAKRVARWQKKFIAELSKRPSVKHACQVANIARARAYEARKEDPEFAERWQQAIDASVDQVEARAFKLALEGEDNVAANLMMFLLKAHKRGVYGDKSEVAFAGGLIVLPAKREGPA